VTYGFIRFVEAMPTLLGAIILTTITFFVLTGFFSKRCRGDVGKTDA
jgi:hypothetical protein